VIAWWIAVSLVSIYFRMMNNQKSSIIVDMARSKTTPFGRKQLFIASARSNFAT